MPEREITLLEGSRSRPVIPVAPIVRTNESAYDVIFRNWHGAPLEQADQF